MATALLERTEPWPVLPERDGYEYVDGKWEKLNVSVGQMIVATNLVLRLREFLREQPLGWALFQDAPYQIWPERPNRYRKPDGSFVPLNTFPDGEFPDGFLHTVPPVVIEVLSPIDLVDSVMRKVDEYFEAGVELVWVLEPAAASVFVYRIDGTITRLREGDTLTGEKVLPGFKVPVAELFKRS